MTSYKDARRHKIIVLGSERGVDLVRRRSGVAAYFRTFSSGPVSAVCELDNGGHGWTWRTAFWLGPLHYEIRFGIKGLALVTEWSAS